MIYPKLIQKNDTIGICAPSNGITNSIKKKRLDNAIKNLTNYGFKVVETKHVRENTLDKQYNIIKARELEILYLNNKISYILCATGGDFLLEILEEINFDIIKNNLKWLQGYSDPTGLLFTITTKYDIATVYGYNAGTFGMKKWHPSLYQNLELLEGKINKQKSFLKFEDNCYDYQTGLEEFHLDMDVKWKNLHDEKEIIINGRLIGGCLDIILNLIGTKFDNIKNFINKYHDDGLIWYFDNCELSYEDLIRALWQFKQCGYLSYCNGIIFGRSMCNDSLYNLSLKEALSRALDNLNIPVIYDADFGHKQPQITLINGCMTEIISTNGYGTIKQSLI